MEPRAEQQFTVLDWVGLGVGWLVVLALASVPFTLAPQWQRMFKDMGGTLPPITTLSLSLWFPLSLAALGASLLAASLLLRGRLLHRRLAVALAVLIALSSLALLLIGLYAPIFTLAGAVK